MTLCGQPLQGWDGKDLKGSEAGSLARRFLEQSTREETKADLGRQRGDECRAGFEADGVWSNRKTRRSATVQCMA